MEGTLYTPGAGHSPPELVGRDDLVDEWHLMLNGLTAQGRVAAEDMLLTGPRGVGKTTMLTAYGEAASEQGFEVLNLQATRHHVSIVEALLTKARSKLEEGKGAWAKARHALERVSGASLGVAGVSVGINTRDAQTASRVNDPGALAEALATLAQAIRDEDGGAGILITIDELQAAHPSDLTLIAAALHRLNVDHPKATVAFAASGLPHTPEVLTKAGVTHPDRLFAQETLPLALTPQQVEIAISLPARRRGVSWHPDALHAVTTATNGYPAHVQLFAHAIWREAPGPRDITLEDANAGITAAAERISRRTLDPRWDRTSDRAREYLAALALNGGEATTKQMATTLDRPHSELSVVRAKLISEGDIYSPRHGQVRMSMPMFIPYVLARYDTSRTQSEVPTLSLDQMRNNQDSPEIPPGPGATPPLSLGRRNARKLPPGQTQRPEGPRP